MTSDEKNKPQPPDTKPTTPEPQGPPIKPLDDPQPPPTDPGGGDVPGPGR